jgi:endonuclease VIII
MPAPVCIPRWSLELGTLVEAMPEGDTVRYLATRITAALAGQRCTRCVTRDPRLSGVNLEGSALVKADAFGKHLFVCFDNDSVLHAHLRMTGSFIISKPVRGPAWRRRVELNFEQGSLVGEDVPILGVIKHADVAKITDHLGPDLCGDAAPDPDEIASRLQRIGETPLAAALLDQRNCAGFGNIYAIELPFIAGVAPTTPIGELQGISTLLALGVGLIRYNATNGRQNTTGRKLGSEDRYIFGRRNGLCPICGSRLIGFTEQESPWRRQTVWCPSCQIANNKGVDTKRLRQLTGLHPGRPRT